MQWSDVAKTCMFGGFEAGEGLQVEWTWTQASLDNSFLSNIFTAQHTKFHANGHPSLSPRGLHLSYHSLPTPNPVLSSQPRGSESCQGRRKRQTLCREAQALGAKKCLKADQQTCQRQSFPPFRLAVGIQKSPMPRRLDKIYRHLSNLHQALDSRRQCA